MPGATPTRRSRGSKCQSTVRPCCGRNGHRGSRDGHSLVEYHQRSNQKWRANGRQETSDVGLVIGLESLNNETSLETDTIHAALLDRFDRHLTTRIPELLAVDINNKVDEAPCNKPIKNVFPKNSNQADVCEKNAQYDCSVSNGRPVAGSEGEAKRTEGLIADKKWLSKGGPHNLNDCRRLTAVKVSRKDTTTQSDSSPKAESISGECEGPPAVKKASKSSPDVSASRVSNSPARPVFKSPTRPVFKSPTRPVSKSPTRPVSKNRSLPQIKRRMRSSGRRRRHLSGVGGISCSMESGRGASRDGYTSGHGRGRGGAGRGGRRGGGMEDSGGSGCGDGVDEDGRGQDGSGSGGRGRGGLGSGGSGDGKRDKKGGVEVKWTFDSGLGAEKSTSEANIGTDITNPHQDAAHVKLKNGSLLVPSQAQQEGLEASALTTRPLFAAVIPCSTLPNTVSSGSALDTTPGVFVQPKEVAESCELAVQESQDCEGGLLYLDPACFPAVPDFGLKPPFKPFSAAWEINFEDTDLLQLPYATPMLESDHQLVGATGPVNDESSDSLVTCTDNSEGNVPLRRPQPFLSICETCEEYPQPPFECKELSTSFLLLRLECIPLPEATCTLPPMEEFVGLPLTTFPQ